MLSIAKAKISSLAKVEISCRYSEYHFSDAVLYYYHKNTDSLLLNSTSQHGLLRNIKKRGRFNLRHASGQSKSLFPHDVIQYLTPVTSAWGSPAFICDWLT